MCDIELFVFTTDFTTAEHTHIYNHFTAIMWVNVTPPDTIFLECTSTT